MRRLALILAIALAPSSIFAATTTKGTTKKSHKKRARVPIVHVSATVRGAALHEITLRNAQPVSVLEGGGALVPFFEQISHPPENMSVHIVQFGDSHTASDDWANQLRQDFQAKFGVGGAGYTLPGHPFPGYRRFDSHGSNSRGWLTSGIVMRKSDGIEGLGGVSLAAQSAGETLTLNVECEQLELHYLRQPGGGEVELSVDGAPVETVDTNGDFGPAVYNYAASPGVHAYTLRTLSSAPVRVFGWVAENHAGVTYEELGINGAQASLMLDWNSAIFEQELMSRDPALIVLAYGTNEALSRSWTAEEYRAGLTQIVQRLREASPTASILLVGPPDCEYRQRGRRLPFPHLDDVIAIQREIARATGCAFWDWRAAMGGDGAVREWVQAGLSQGDYTHLTSAGYRMIGGLLFDEIMSQYSRFLTIRAEGSQNQ
ncbi:MAG TPA: SGNH/GDSL hydrolase family protein [Bryobacteraceae bacterium]|nr:SGNH/GDSL hydrolase family protein [Bryobacteraceae bacterium]